MSSLELESRPGLSALAPGILSSLLADSSSNFGFLSEFESIDERSKSIWVLLSSLNVDTVENVENGEEVVENLTHHPRRFAVVDFVGVIFCSTEIEAFVESDFDVVGENPSNSILTT